MSKRDFDKLVAEINQKEMDLAERTISFSDGRLTIFYISQMVDRNSLSENVIKPLMLYLSSTGKKIKAQLAMDSVIYADDCRVERKVDLIDDLLLSGMVIILFSNDTDYLVVNLRKVEHRNIKEPSLQYTGRGPQDSFTENLDVNLSLVRYRLKDKNLRIKHFQVGRRTKARVAMLYVEDIANNTVVSEMQKRIEKIDVDGIGESGELQDFLQNSKMQVFPNIGVAERSDYAYTSLIEGKVVVLVDGSHLALIAPKVFAEFFYSGDDRFNNKFFGIFGRTLRYIAILISLTASSLYVALSSFHTDALPVKYAISLAEMRVDAPFNAFAASLILEFFMELLREALLRVPKQIGSAAGIVGTIVIGQAAIDSRIFSPVLLILMSLSLLASFAIPDYGIINVFRMLKILLLIFTGLLGFYGFAVIMTVILIELVSLNSFGVPYFAPWAPYNKVDAPRTLMYNTLTMTERPQYLRTKDKTRINQKGKKAGNK